MSYKVKKTLSSFILIAIMVATSIIFTACNKNATLLNPKKPTTLTMWHVYGEQVGSPMNEYIEQFNSTVGKEKGVVINVALMSNASQIGKKLKDAQTGKAGSKDLPDLFFVIRATRVTSARTIFSTGTIIFLRQNSTILSRAF